MEYEDLSDELKASLGEGHVLARHTSLGAEHLTTVYLAYAHTSDGHALHFCMNVCNDVFPGTEFSIVPVEYGHAVLTDSEKLSVIAENVEVIYRKGQEMMARLELLRASLFEKYREGIHKGLLQLAAERAEWLFVVVCGAEAGDLPEEFVRFQEFLAEAVVNDEAVLPEYEMGGGGD